MIGFYSYIRALNNCTRETLEAGAEYAQKFRDNAITTDQYRTEMFEKIHSIAVKNAHGNEELYNHLDSDFAKPAFKYLDRTVQEYKEGSGIAED